MGFNWTLVGGSKGGGWIAARTSVAATLGGTASALAGGKFTNGAVTSAFQHLFNAEADKHLGKAKDGPTIGVVFLEEGLVNKSAGLEARLGVDILNKRLERAGVKDRVIWVPYKSMADLDAKVSRFVEAGTIHVAVTAHGLFRNPRDVSTFTGRVTVGALSVDSGQFRSKFALAVDRVNVTTVAQAVFCSSVGYAYNQDWRYEMALRIEQELIRRKEP